MTRHFHYIVVGAGSAGCVLAARLTEDPALRVLLVEAGPPDRSWRIHMPAAVGTLLSTSRFNWSYVSEPEPFLDGRRLAHPRGRVLGGSSSINGMVYIRGHADDYNAWAASGLDGWGYADVLPYFKIAERHLHGADAYHGGTGPLPVYAPDVSASPLAAAFVDAALQAGYGFSADPNGERQEGFGRVDRTTEDNRRCSTARAYLSPARQRPNLTIVTGALVHRILLHGDHAIGIEYVHRRTLVTAHADAEVILSAGAINSPQLLQLSGIGAPAELFRAGIQTHHDLPAVGEHLNDHPDLVVQHRCLRRVSIHGAKSHSVTANREVILCGGAVDSPQLLQLLQLSGVGPAAHLSTLGVPVVLDNPAVGGNLQDHLAVSYYYEATQPTLNNELHSPFRQFLAGVRYMLTRTGPLGLSVNQFGGFVRARPGGTRPDQQLYFSPVTYGIGDASRKRIQVDAFRGFLLCFQPSRPTSRGRIDIASADYRQPPGIAPNYLATDEDIADVVHGGQLIQRIARTRAMRTLIRKPVGPDVDQMDDAAMVADFRARSATVYHPVSTCRMGPDPAASVVDPELRVHGIERLRIIDASVFPTVTSGNTNAPTLMVARRAADLILAG